MLDKHVKIYVYNTLYSIYVEYIDSNKGNNRVKYICLHYI